MKKNLCFLLCIMFIFAMVGCSGKSESVRLYYYYFDACGACNESDQFYNMASSELKGINSSEYQIITVNIFKDKMPESLKLFLKDNRLSMDDISYPMLATENNYILGQENIRQGIRELLISRINHTSFYFDNGKTESFRTSSKQGFQGADKLNRVDKSDSYFIYFYTSACKDCSHTQSFLKTLPQNYQISMGGKIVFSNLVIEHKNIVQQDNLSELESFFDYYHVPKGEREVPVMFYSKGYISGYKNIKSNMESIIRAGKALDFDPANINSGTGGKQITVKSLPGIFMTGLVNGLNPCSISMLFLLLSLVVSRQTGVLKIGFSYVLGKIAAYFSFGMATYGIISFIDSIAFRNLQYAIGIILLIVSLLLAFLNFRDAYFAKKERYTDIKMQLPGPLRKYNHKIISYFAAKSDSNWIVVLIFLLSIIISLGEFLCTGQIYVATIVYLAQNTSKLTSITVLSFVLYVLAVSIPLIILVILVNKTKKLLSISEYIRKHLPIIKAVFGLTFLIFGILFCTYFI